MYRKKREDKTNLLNVMFALGLANPWTSLYMEGTAITVYSLFAIIQSTFYRLIKGQQYLKNMYEINCDD